MNIIKNSKTLKVFLLFTIVLSFFIAPNSAFASERANYLKDQLVSTVFAQGNVYQAQRGSADNQFIRECDSSYSQISINNLYGTDSRTFIYQGEVPNIDDNSYKDGSNYKYRHLSTDWMGGTNRIWWNGNLNDGKGKSDDETDKKGWKRLKCDWEANNHVKDLHAYALTKQGNALNIDLGRSFNDFAWNILASLNGVCSMVTTTLISIANFDVLDLFNKIGFSAISNMISKLVIGENYNSPIFYIAILCFLISIICMIVQFIKSGNASFGKIISEFGIFIVALVIMAASLNGNFSKVINSTNNLVSQISSDLSASSSASTQLYVNSSGKPLTDTKNNQIAITMKPYIDTLIERQFGYTVDELDIYKDGDDSVSNKNWGVATTQEMKTLIKNLNSANTDVIFDVRTKTKDQGGFTNGDQPNLGYFWYAACSTTNYQDPFTRDYANKKISLNQGDDSVLLYMTDLLAEIDAQNDSGSEKCQNIMRSFHEGTGQGSLGSLILCILVTCCLALALVMASAYCLFGKVLFVGGMVLMPFIGICMLITKTRKIAKSLAITWLNGLIKMLVGMLYVSLIIYISAAVCSAGVLGKVLDIALLIAAFKFGPQLLAAVANAATKFTGGSNAQMGFANNFDRGFNNFANKFGGGHGIRLAEQAYLRGKKGEMGDKPGAEKYLKNGKKDANEMINNFSNGNGKGGKDDGSGVGIGGVLPVSFSGDERRELNDNLEAVDHEYEKKINAVNLNSVLDTDGNKFKSKWHDKMFHAVLAVDGALKKPSHKIQSAKNNLINKLENGDNKFSKKFKDYRAHKEDRLKDKIHKMEERQGKTSWKKEIAGAPMLGKVIQKKNANKLVKLKNREAAMSGDDNPPEMSRLERFAANRVKISTKDGQQMTLGRAMEEQKKSLGKEWSEQRDKVVLDAIHTKQKENEKKVMSAIVGKTEEKACEVSANYWTAKDMTEKAKEAAKQGTLKKSGYFNLDGYGGLSEGFDKENVDTVLEGTRKDGALGQSLKNKKNS